MATNIELGKEGENFAVEYLKEKRYKIIERNARKKWGELDIIAKSKEGTLVFFEVKTIGSPMSWVSPEDQMTRSKKKKFFKTAYGYANAHPEYMDDEKGFRCDVLALTKKGKDFVVNHYENIS